MKNQRENMEVEKRIQLKEIYDCPKCGISIDKKQDDYRAMCNNCNFNFEVILTKTSHSKNGPRTLKTQ